MGLVSFGVPREIVLQLAKLNSIDCFVETGTYQGRTTRWAASEFSKVHTIERSEIVYNTFGPALDHLPGVTRHFADSRAALPKICNELGARPAVFWLDGHWSGGDTAGATDECPIMEELQCLESRNDDIILIDDARLFLCAPPKPHDPTQWPGIDHIALALSRFKSKRFMQVIDDVIFIVPDQGPNKDCLTDYAQQRASEQKMVPQRKPLPSRIRELLHLTPS